MTEGASVTLVPSAPGSGEMVWPMATPDRRARIHYRVQSPDRAALRQATDEARTALEEAVVAAAVAAQRVRSIATVLEEALAILAAAETGSAPRPAIATQAADSAGSLSPREREVLALVAEGRSNKDIAAALFVSPNTIKTHVSSLLNKLHADTRVQLAAIATRQALL